MKRTPLVIALSALGIATCLPVLAQTDYNSLSTNVKNNQNFTQYSATQSPQGAGANQSRPQGGVGLPTSTPGQGSNNGGMFDNRVNSNGVITNTAGGVPTFGGGIGGVNSSMPYGTPGYNPNGGANQGNQTGNSVFTLENVAKVGSVIGGVVGGEGGVIAVGLGGAVGAYNNCGDTFTNGLTVGCAMNMATTATAVYAATHKDSNDAQIAARVLGVANGTEIIQRVSGVGNDRVIGESAEDYAARKNQQSVQAWANARPDDIQTAGGAVMQGSPQPGQQGAPMSVVRNGQVTTVYNDEQRMSGGLNNGAYSVDPTTGVRKVSNNKYDLSLPGGDTLRMSGAPVQSSTVASRSSAGAAAMQAPTGNVNPAGVIQTNEQAALAYSQAYQTYGANNPITIKARTAYEASNASYQKEVAWNTQLAAAKPGTSVPEPTATASTNTANTTRVQAAANPWMPSGPSANTAAGATVNKVTRPTSTSVADVW